MSTTPDHLTAMDDASYERYAAEAEREMVYGTQPDRYSAPSNVSPEEFLTIIQDLSLRLESNQV